MSTLPLKVRLIIHIDWRKALLPELRKVVTFDEDIYIEGERASNLPLRMIGVAAVVKSESGVGVDLPAGALREGATLEVKVYDIEVKISDDQPGDPIKPAGKILIRFLLCFGVVPS